MQRPAVRWRRCSSSSRRWRPSCARRTRAGWSWRRWRRAARGEAWRRVRARADRLGPGQAAAAPSIPSLPCNDVWPALSSSASAPPRCLDDGDVDLLHRHHRLEDSLRLPATSRERIGQRARGDLPGEAPAVLAPTALAFRSAIADDRVPVTVRLFLILRRDLEGKGLGVPERRAAVETETGNAQDSELHRQHIALFAARIVTGSLVNSGYFTIGKDDGVETRRLMRVLVEPEADRILWLHVRVLLVLDQGERRGLCVGPYQ